MELQALLVLCGVGVAGVAVLLLMSLFSSSGTSYEEAIAQQRKATTELIALAENKNKSNKKNTKKAIKKQARKEKKETAVASTGSDHESEAPAESGVEDEPISAAVPAKGHVEFSPPVVVDVARDAPPNVKIRKRGKDPKVKPILLNKEDPSCVCDPATLAAPAPSAIVNHFDEIHPKDEFELLQSTLAADKVQVREEPAEKPAEKKDSKAAKSAKAPKAAAVPKPAPPVEAIKEEVRERRDSGDAPKEQRKVQVREEPAEKPAEKKDSKAAKSAKAPKAAAVPKPAPPVEAIKEEVRERRDSGDAPKEQRKAKKAEKKPEKPVEEMVEAVREEVVPPLNAPQPSELTTEKLLKQALANPPPPAPAAATAATATPPGGKKKKKAEPNVLTLMAGDSGGVNVGELVRVVREAALSRTEIQILTDALLNKHHDPLPEHSEWTEGPNDPMQKLKKQLADKEKALADELEASQALHAKLKELRASLNVERARAGAAARAAEATGAELLALQARLARLAEDNHALAQDKLMLQQKLSAEAEMQAQRVQMEMHIQRLSETEAALVQQLAALQAECGAHALDASSARDSALVAQQHAADMAHQLQEANRFRSELEQQRQAAARGEQRAQRELQDALAAMTELQNEVQRVSSRAHAAEANAEKIMEEAEKQKQQLSSEITSLSEQLAAKESELAEIKQLKAVPAQNGLPSPNEQHKAAELAKVESVVTSLRAELSAAQAGSRAQRDQLAALSDQLHAYRDKNNELRTKNWKVMEALQSAERALQTKASAMPAHDLREAITKAQEAQYNEMATILRAVFPSAAPGATAGKDWLQTFADNLNKELQKREAEKLELEKRVAERVVEKVVVEKIVEKVIEPVAALPPVDGRLTELQSQNEHLQGLVDKYKTVIDDTEGVLSRLQQNVTTEEQRWAQQLAEKQRELDDLRQRTVQQEPLEFAYACIEKSLAAIMEEMQSKINALEAQLAQANATNHNHSFADAERLTEERLMGGLSEKLSLDVCNGPSQVGLEDK